MTKEYEIARGFELMSVAFAEDFREGYGWLGNYPEKEIGPCVDRQRARGYEVQVRRPTFIPSGEIDSGKGAVLVKRIR